MLYIRAVKSKKNKQKKFSTLCMKDPDPVLAVFNEKKFNLKITYFLTSKHITDEHR